MAGRITRVALTNYRSIASCDVELQPLTFLVGPNGSGKSNFLDALRFLMHTTNIPLEQAVELRSGIRSVLRKLPGGQSAKSFSIHVDFELENEVSGTYSLEIEEGEIEGSARISSEHCTVGEDWFRSDDTFVSNSTTRRLGFAGGRSALSILAAQPAFEPVSNLFLTSMFYVPNSEKMRTPVRTGFGAVLARDASNAADVLLRLKLTKPDQFERVQDYFRVFNPEFAEVNTGQGGGFGWLEFTPAANPTSWTLNGADVSDGTLRALGVLLAVFQANNGTVPISLVGLEEPESNLHPAAAGILFDALVEASLTTPILASTHSADLLDRKDFPENAILAVALEDGQTIIGPIAEGEQTILRKRLYTAGELLRSNYLTPAPASLASGR